MKRTGPYTGILTLTVLLVGLPLIVYLTAVRRTVREWRSCRQAEKRIQVLDNQPRPAGLYEETSAPVREEALFNQILPCAGRYRVNVEKFTPFLTGEQGGLLTYTDEYLLQGEFIPLVRLIRHIERELTGCRIVSLHFHTVKPLGRNAEKQLKLKMLVQHLATDKTYEK